MNCKNLIFFLALVLMLPHLSHGQELNVATYNIRYDNKGDAEKGDGWQTRNPVIASQVLFFDFDLMGVQEAMDHQLEDLDKQLGGYARIGVGRDDGKKAGEYSAIFYKKDRFKLLNHATFWLSETPEKPSKGWDAALNRVCTWGQFREKESGKEFFHFNLHFDHQGEEARKNSTSLVLEKIREIAGDSPVILSGDFNFDQDHPNYALINNSGKLKDTYGLAAVRLAPNGTFSGFDFNGTKHDKRIDHIFVSKDFTVTRYAILTGSYKGHFPSDHFPVLALLELK